MNLRAKSTSDSLRHLCCLLDENRKVYFSRFGDGDYSKEELTATRAQIIFLYYYSNFPHETSGSWLFWEIKLNNETISNFP